MEAEAALAADVDAVFHGVTIELPDAVLEGDRALFSRLYVEHKSSLRYLAARFLHDPRDVDEVVQETFLRLFLALPELETEGRVAAWARRTATNLCIDRYRAAQRRPDLIDLDRLPEEFGAECDEDALVAAEDAAIVRAALADLPPLYRQALVAREVEGMPLDAIAARLDVEPAQMKHLLHRARRAMRRSLESRAGRAVAGLMAALLAVLSVGTGARFLGGSSKPSASTLIAGSAFSPRFDDSAAPAPVRAAGRQASAPKVSKATKVRTTPLVRTARTRALTPRVSGEPSTPARTRPAQLVGAPVSVAPPATRPPAPVAPLLPAGPAFTVEGGLSQLSAPTLAQQPGSSASTFSAVTSAGELTVQQTLTRVSASAASVRLDRVVLGGEALSVGQILLESTMQRDGSLALTIFASIDAPLTEGARPLPTALTLSVVLPAQGARIAYEHVAVA